MLPSHTLASMTAYDLNTDPDGYYLEHLTVPGYAYYVLPLRASSGAPVTSSIFVNSLTRTFTGTGVGPDVDAT